MMFDFKEFYSRIADELPDNCRVCEVGVADMNSALFLAQRLRDLGKNFNMSVVDNMDYGGYEQMKTIYLNIIAAGFAFDIDVVPYDSVKASEKFNDCFLDFIFLDSSHLYEPTKQEIKAWYPKLKDNGILAGHDFFGHEEVNRAVKEMLPEMIQREPINKPDQQQIFQPEKFLHTESTSEGYGVWWCVKKFYYAIR